MKKNLKFNMLSFGRACTPNVASVKFALLLLGVFGILLSPQTGHASWDKKANRVVVKKSQRQLVLYHNNDLLKIYSISLGKNPVGHKRYRGDCRTPEGRYVLDWRNPQSRFFKSIHISYPNAMDRRRAERLGLSPGGNIMIHGLPNKYRTAPELFEGLDWTDGCIAVTNQDMREIWRLVADHSVIEIYP